MGNAVKVVQFGEGNFLRAFADAYFHTLNQEGGNYQVHIIKPAVFGSLDKFERQHNAYHVVLRGVKNGSASEEVYPVSCVKDVFSPFEEDGLKKYYALARDEAVKLIVSNTTEAGICYRGTDGFDDDFADISYPAKLTKFLYARYQAGLPGVHLMPVELIENNADELKRCVEQYIALWALPEGFAAWNASENVYCNTLVDRIVSGYPRDEETKVHLTALIGEEDELMTVGEPFGLWAVEKKGHIADYIREGKHNIDVVLTENIGYYKKRKVRVLNGSHTNLVAAGILLGKETVYDCMTDDALSAFVDGSLKEEIIPFVSDDVASTTDFAESVKERFSNPYLNHQLKSIALNSISKWRARCLPSLSDYYAAHGRIPEKMTVGFSYLMALYQTRASELADDKEYLDYFLSGGKVGAFLQRKDVWGEDLTAYRGFAEKVEDNVRRIINGEVLL